MASTIDQSFFAVDLSRIERLAPFWRQCFAGIRNFPAPALFAPSGKEDGGHASQKAQALLEAGLDPLSADASAGTLYFYGALCIAQRRYKEALPVFEHLLAALPTDSALLFMRGMAQFGLDRHTLAWRDFSRSFALNPQLEHSRLALAYLCGFTRDHRQALSLLEPLAPRLNEIISWWDAARHVPLICFQAEYLLFGQSAAGGLDSRFAETVTAAQHLSELVAWLPSWHELLAWKSAPLNSFFTSCDAVYFHRFAIPLLLSHLDSGGKEAFHVHVVNPDTQVGATIARLAPLFQGRLRITTEAIELPNPSFASIYYSAARFCRMAQFFLQSEVDYYMIDADMLINQALPEFVVDGNAGGCYLSCAEAEPMWDYYLAGFGVYNQNDACSREILCTASHFIMRSIQAGKYRWFLDQVGLFLSAHQHPTGPRTLDCKQFCDLEHRDDTYIWAVTNDKNLPAFNARRDRLLEEFGMAIF